MGLGNIADKILPALFGKRNSRIQQLLTDAEVIADKELRSNEILAEMYITFYQFLDTSKQAKIQHELIKNYADVEKVEILRPYCAKAITLLEKIRIILYKVRKFNERSIANAAELGKLITEKNEAFLGHLTRGQLKMFMGFQQDCNERYRERVALRNILGSVALNIDNMILLLEKASKDLSAFNNDEFIHILTLEKEALMQSVQKELQQLGLEVESFENLDELYEIGPRLFNLEFIDRSRYMKKVLKRNQITKRTALTLLSMHFVGFQIVAPVYLAGLESKYKSLETHFPEIHAELQSNSEAIVFRTPDNLELTGMLVFNKEKVRTNKAVLVVHGRNYNYTFHGPYIKYLRDNTSKIDFFAINLRGHGPDTPQGFLTEAAIARSTTMGLKESLDVVGAINHLASLGYNEVVLYGHSVGGAAVLHGAGMHKDMISSNITVKGVIVEKTFSDVNKFFYRLYNKWLSNFGANIKRGLTGTEFVKGDLGKPTYVQWMATQFGVETIAGYKFADNKPYESAKKIDAPFLAMGNHKGDAMMDDSDIAILAKSAPHGTSLIVDSQYSTLQDRHNPENDNPTVLNALKNFIKKNLG